MLNICRCILIFTLLVACSKQTKDSFEDPIITVNQSQLSGSDFSKRLVRKFVEQEVKYPKPEIINVLKKQIVEDFILQTIFENYAQEKNILVKKEDLDFDFKKFKKGFPDSDSFGIFLNESGQSIKTFKKSLKEETLRNLVKKDLFETQDLKLEKKELLDFYNKNIDQFQREDQIHLKQIVFESDEDGNKIKALLKKTGTKNFENLARKYSLGPEKKDGGDLGWVNTSSYSAFAEAAKTSNGGITDIIKSENGSHIFKVVDKRKKTTLSFGAVEKQIAETILKDKKNVYINSWVRKRIGSSKIKVNEDLLNKISVNRPTNL